MLDIQSEYLAEIKSEKLQRADVSVQREVSGQRWERILNVCKSSWLSCIEVKWDVDIYYRPIAAKLTPQILRPEHRKYKRDSADGSFCCSIIYRAAADFSSKLPGHHSCRLTHSLLCKLTVRKHLKQVKTNISTFKFNQKNTLLFKVRLWFGWR